MRGFTVLGCVCVSAFDKKQAKTCQYHHKMQYFKHNKNVFIKILCPKFV